MKQLPKLDPDKPFQMPFMINGISSGATIRSACIGLAFALEEYDKIIEVSVESSRMTHHHPMGYLGSIIAALFTRLALD